MLKPSDPHFWAPIPEVMRWLADRLPADAKVLEIGPGYAPFSRADTFVDFVDLPDLPKDRVFKCDIATEPLPFADKSFDFVFCRHALEDMYNPFPICAEMSRVAKAGYVETPSPIAEMCRGIDGGPAHYRGYHHHRFMVWDNDGELQFVSKYPVVEYLDPDDKRLAERLRASPKYWNTYHLWDGEIKLKHWQSPLDYSIPEHYHQIIANAMNASVVATDKFYSAISTPALRSVHAA